MRVSHRDEGHVQPNIEQLAIERGDLTLKDYPHYMLKEIFEQPESIRDTMRGRLCEDDATAVFGGLESDAPSSCVRCNRILLTACGTSWHAALVGEYVIEELARMPVEVEYASELRYRNPPVDDKTMLFAITQSGETADTLAALREMKRKGHPTLAICNVVGSTIAQEADGGIYLHAGPEIGVASTKAYTSQCMVLTMLALYFGRLRHLSYEAGRRIIDALQRVAGPGGKGAGDQRRSSPDCRQVLPRQQLPLPGPAVQFPHGPGRCLEAEGNQLHPRRRLSGRRDETRPDRPGRRTDAQRVHHAAGISSTTK